jgi:23S rRNA pseudouridine2605 synthase
VEERIQKILAKAGFGSRRANEELISANRVTVNGRPVILGQKADSQRDQIAVDGKLIRGLEPPVYIALHKPRNILSDIQENDTRTSARDMVPVEGHLFPVGRLDYDSEGLLLLTNDGELANRLTHPRFRHEKEYRVLVITRPDEKQLAAWRRGVVLEDGEKTLPAGVEVESAAGDGAWLRIILREGKKRQIREVGKRIGLPVSRIIRVRIGDLLLGTLKPGQWRHLTSREVSALKRSAEAKKPQYKPGEASPGMRKWKKPAEDTKKSPGRKFPGKTGR